MEVRGHTTPESQEIVGLDFLQFHGALFSSSAFLYIGFRVVTKRKRLAITTQIKDKSKILETIGKK